MRDTDTPERAAERAAHRAAAEQAWAEALARFGPVTPDNAREFLAWRARRVAEIKSWAPAR